MPSRAGVELRERVAQGLNSIWGQSSALADVEVHQPLLHIGAAAAMLNWIPQAMLALHSAVCCQRIHSSICYVLAVIQA